MQLKLLILFAIAAPFLANCRQPASTPTPNESLSVTNLIEQLASKTPPPYTNNADEIPREIEFKAYSRYCTPEVETAIQKLRELGPPIYPELIKHLGDKRYSYSQIVAAWLNHGVSDALIVVLSDEHYMHSGYKWRDAPKGDGSYLSFEDYLRGREIEKWAQWASNKTKLEIQGDFIDWCVREEEKRGFTDESQRQRILKNYQNARVRVAEEYSKKP
jgi:hypothetical protein